MSESTLRVRRLGLVDYLPVFKAMQAFNASRDEHTSDELWLLEHPPVFTQGMNGKPEHLLAPGDIPVVPIDRGGQVTYHGPGQLVAYLLLDIRRRGKGPRFVVSAMEQAVIRLLGQYHLQGHARPDAPGVYVNEAKVAALGLRVKGRGTYHGLSLNVHMELSPFERINPCGYAGMNVVDLHTLGVDEAMAEISDNLLQHLVAELGYRKIQNGGDQIPHV